MSSIRPLIPLLIAAGILLGGNGLQGTLIALRGAQEGFSPATIGFMGTAYFGGFVLGCLFITRMMKAVGHVRAFSALAAIASAGTLLLVLVIDPIFWSAMRFVTGFCFAGLFTVMESWLNSGVPNHDRARVLALYRIVDIGSVTGAQFLIPVVRRRRLRHLRHHVDHDHAVAGAGVARRPLQPDAAGGRQARSARASGAFRRSPASAASPSASPTAPSARCRPVYAEQIGMSVDRRRHLRQRRHHRRRADPVSARLPVRPLGPAHASCWSTTGGAMLAALALVFLAGTDPLANFVARLRLRLLRHAALFAVGRARQRPRRTRASSCCVNAALMLFYSFGAIGGPFAASFVMAALRPAARSSSSAPAVYVVFILIILYRMRARSGVPAEQRGRFIALLRTSTDLRPAGRGAADRTPPATAASHGADA